MYPSLPVVLIKASQQDKLDARDIYACPVYKTQQRGPTYVFAAGLKTKAPPAKWVMAGVSMLLDVAAVRVNPAKAEGLNFMVNIRLTDRNEKHLLTVENGVLIHEEGIEDAKAGATVTMTRPELMMTLLAGFPLSEFTKTGSIEIEGDASLYETLTSLIEAPKPNFNIVEP